MNRKSFLKTSLTATALVLSGIEIAKSKPDRPDKLIYMANARLESPLRFVKDGIIYQETVKFTDLEKYGVVVEESRSSDNIVQFYNVYGLNPSVEEQYFQDKYRYVKPMVRFYKIDGRGKTIAHI